MLGAALAGCESVPDLLFVSDDAAADDAAADAGAARAEAGAVDAGKPGVACPSPGPTGGRCCGIVWCVDACSEAQCELCKERCAEGEICCAKSGTVLCKAKCP